MSSAKRYLLFLFFLTVTACSGFAQNTGVPPDTSGYIIMSGAELQSFIRKVATLKKQYDRQRAMQYPTGQSEKGDKTVVPVPVRERDGVDVAPVRVEVSDTHEISRQSNDSADKAIYSEIGHINSRIDTLMQILDDIAKKEAVPSSNPQPATIERRVEAAQPRPQKIAISQPRYQQPYPTIIYREKEEKKKTAPGKPEPAADTSLVEQQQERQAMRDRIAGLEQQITLLTRLSQGADTTETKNNDSYNKDISELSNQIRLLTARLDEKTENPAPQSKDTIVFIKKETDSALLKTLRSLSTRIYFANSSAEVSSDDGNRLDPVVRYIKDHPQTIIVLKGFSSPVGNPEYNNRLSMLRADNVRKWLLNNGVNPDQIIAVRQGVDHSVGEAEARRVEVTLMIY